MFAHGRFSGPGARCDWQQAVTQSLGRQGQSAGPLRYYYAIIGIQLMEHTWYFNGLAIIQDAKAPARV